jgi:hypothetical protein
MAPEHLNEVVKDLTTATCGWSGWSVNGSR